jgi:hypothetical protein
MDLMKTLETANMHRRKFLLTSSFFLSGAAALKTSALLAQTAPATGTANPPKRPALPEELSLEEQARVKDSIMSSDMQNFWHKGYSCAETGLMVALRFMKKPEDMVWMASGFAGGLMHQDLCGFLTSGVMAIGLHSGDLKMEKNAAMMQCSQKVQQYWTWWTEMAPLHCAQIREGREPMDFKVCERLGRLATAKIESLLKA